MGAHMLTQPLTRADRTAPTPRRGSCCRRRRGQRPVAELRAKRYDVPARNARAAPRPGVRSRPVRPDTAVYRRRRRVAGLAVAVAVTVLSLGVQAAITGPDSGPASAAGTGTVVSERTVRAQPGDSLWSIAQEHRGDIGINRYIDKLIELNGGVSIQVGQLVRLP